MLHILGLGHFHPDNRLDNAFFESLDIGTDEAWITSRVGILERRTVLPLDYIRTTYNQDLRAGEEAALLSNAQTGAKAAEVALARAGISASDVGMVIAGGCSPKHCIPAEAATVAAQLGLEVPAFDLHAACSTFGAHMHFCRQLGDALPDYVLCLALENNTRVVNYRDRATCVLWGDASAAAVISNRHPGKLRVAASTFGGAPSGALDVVVPRTGFFAQNGAKVQKFAIKRMTELVKRCLAEAPEATYVGHQANLTMLKSVAKRCGLAARHWHNIEHFGNQGAAGAPTVVSQRWDELRPGQALALVVVGSGLSWARLTLEVTDFAAPQ